MMIKMAQTEKQRCRELILTYLKHCDDAFDRDRKEITKITAAQLANELKDARWALEEYIFLGI